MKTLTIAAFIFSLSAGLVNASDHTTRDVARHALQAMRTDMSPKSAAPCLGIPGQQSVINRCGEYVPSVFDPGPGTD